jgi:hypothetical protein
MFAIYTPQLQSLNQRTHRDVTFEGAHSGVTDDQVFWVETLFIGANIFSDVSEDFSPFIFEVNQFIGHARH